MIQQVVYDEDDIERFLEVTKQIEAQDEESQTLRKILNVQNKISILANIEPSDLKAILFNLKFIKYKRKDIIIEEGDVSQEIFFILSGECQVFVKKRDVGTLNSGMTFGESAAIFKSKRNATVACLSNEATLLSFSINHDNMEFCANALANIYKNLALQINNKLEEMNSKMTTKK